MGSPSPPAWQTALYGERRFDEAFLYIELPPQPCKTLASETGGALELLGLPAEGRPFRPHLTLARIRGRVPLEALREAVAALPSLDFGGFSAGCFFLYHSRPGPAGSVYTKLAEFPLSK